MRDVMRRTKGQVDKLTKKHRCYPHGMDIQTETAPFTLPNEYRGRTTPLSFFFYFKGNLLSKWAFFA